MYEGRPSLCVFESECEYVYVCVREKLMWTTQEKKKTKKIYSKNLYEKSIVDESV